MEDDKAIHNVQNWMKHQTFFKYILIAKTKKFQFYYNNNEILGILPRTYGWYHLHHQQAWVTDL